MFVGRRSQGAAASVNEEVRKVAQTDDRIELPAPAKRRRRWPWVAGYVLTLAVIAYFGVTVDQTGNNENGVWAAFFIVMAVGGVFLWRLTRR